MFDVLYFITFSSDVYFSNKSINTGNMCFEFLKLLVTSRQYHAYYFWILSELCKEWNYVIVELIWHTRIDKKIARIFYVIFFEKFWIDDYIIGSSAIFLINFCCFCNIRKSLGSKNIPFTIGPVRITECIIEIENKEDHSNYAIVIFLSRYTS